MIAPAPEPTAALSSHYRLDRTEEWELLLRRLRVRDQFTFLPVFAPEDAGVEIARRALESWLEKNDGRLVTITLQPGGSPDSLTRALIDLPEDSDSVHWVQAAPLDPTDEKESQLSARWHDPIANLNSRRNELQRSLRAPLIFAGPEELSPYLRDHAPDLWDIRGGAHYLQPPEFEQNPHEILQRFGVNFSIPGDPDFTLSLANELDGRPDRAEERSALLSRAGRQAFHHWDLSRAEKLFRESLRISREIGSGPEVLWQREDYLSRILHEMARNNEALDHAESALAAAELAHGPESSEVGTVSNNLGTVLDDLGKPVRAELAYRKAIEIGEKFWSGGHPEIATRLSNLAHLLLTQGRHMESESLLRRALEIDRQIFGFSHPVVSGRLNNLAQLFQQQGKLAEAIQVLKKGIDILDRANDQESPELAVLLNNLGEVYRYQGKLDEAEPLLRRALMITESKLGGEHPDAAIRLNNLANLLANMGNQMDAELYSRRQLKILFLYKKRNGISHLHEQRGIKNYSDILKLMGRSSDEIAAEIQGLKDEVDLIE